MKRWAKIGLFISSYSPLFILLAVQEWQNKVLGEVHGFNVLPLIFAAGILAGLTFIAGLIFVSKKSSVVSVHVVEVRTSNQDTLSYLITYLVPFIGLKFNDDTGLVVNLLLLAFIGTLYLQSNMIYLNPVLNLAGFKLYRFKARDGNEKIILAKKQPKVDTNISAVILGESLYVTTKD